jgi:hypothetical protein
MREVLRLLIRLIAGVPLLLRWSTRAEDAPAIVVLLPSKSGSGDLVRAQEGDIDKCRSVCSKL